MTDVSRDPSSEGAPPVAEETLDRIADSDVYDVNGDKVGAVGRVYLRDETGRPSWVTVKSGFFGLRESLVPMSGVDIVGDEIRAPYTKHVIKGAPHVDTGDHLSPADEEELQSYYRAHGWQEEEAHVAGPGERDAVVGEARRDDALAEEAEAGAERREERFDAMEERVDELRDTSATDALLAGTGAGVTGAGTTGGESDAAEVPSPAEREREVRAADAAARTDADQEGPGHLATDDFDVAAPPAGVSPGIGVADTGVPVDTPWQESLIEEVRDGGYGIGSAAPLGEGKQPLGHAVRAWEDTKSFRTGPAVGVEREPDVWFFDEQAAYNSGFHPAD